MKKTVEYTIQKIMDAGTLPSDPPEQRTRKTILIVLVVFYTIFALFWGSVYLGMGLPLSAAIPYGYGAISLITLVFLFSTKGSRHYGFFRFTQLLLILILPFLVQWSLGGFERSGAVMIWALLSPVGALMFSGTSKAVPWFFGYLLLSVLSGCMNTICVRLTPPIDELASTVFFVVNITGVTTITFFLLRFFVQKGEEAFEELGHRHTQVRKEKERLSKIKSMMAYFIPETAKKMIEKSPEKDVLEKYIQDASVLFLDIEGFTVLTKKYDYEEINRTIEFYFSRFFDLIHQQGGDINETCGDGMMVVFMDDHTINHAHRAVRTAIDIQKICREEKPGSASDLIPIRVNIGINTGEVYLGSTKLSGDKIHRWTFTASGQVTILAARLSDYAQNGQILIGEETARRVENDFVLDSLTGVSLKNLEGFGAVFSVDPHTNA
jgi:class 3 adenylate cyclase